MKLIKEAYHFGDLDYNRPAELANIIIGQRRGTGHFGTGFYTVGFYDEKRTPSTYWKRNHWEINLDAYDLFKPKDNNEAYTLHSTFKTLDDLDTDVFKNLNPDALYHELDDLEYEYDNQGILKFIKKYMPELINNYQFRSDLEEQRWGAIEDYAKDYIRDIEDAYDDLEVIIENLHKIFKFDKRYFSELLKRIVSKDSNDSYGTRVMKELGYEGIDVSHLSDSSGYDNFSYGSVVYNLKPGTYKKIK